MQTQVPGIIPEAVKFMRQVERNRIIEGVYPISSMPRLNEVLLDNKGYAEVKLEFGHSVGFPSLKGRVTAALTVECQRCLQPMEIEVAGNFKFALVHSEDDFELLPDEFEPYIVNDEEQSILDIVEDELLLDIPMVTVHEIACSDFMKSQEAAIKADREASHPFAALKALKGTKKE
jgi:uncharacterized protein